ncbi:hypothetical protein CH253_08055 [Rhodococcus sp. 06-156-3C]|nr:hypothetical protein CH253_08055 [Rhodococcus sp. 06-156-3C]
MFNRRDPRQIGDLAPQIALTHGLIAFCLNRIQLARQIGRSFTFIFLHTGSPRAHRVNQAGNPGTTKDRNNKRS